jgi:hypothetical protein
MRRLFTILSLGAAALVSTAAASDEEAARQAMLDAFDAALTAVAYASSGLALFALVWAGFLLMADGAEGRGTRARSAVFLAIAGLGVALSAKGLAALISAGLIPIPIP